MILLAPPLGRSKIVCEPPRKARIDPERASDLVHHVADVPSLVLAQRVNSLRSMACFMRSWDV